MTKTVSINHLYHRLNLKEKTASVVDYYDLPNEIIIPRSIVHDSTEYIVITISKKAFKKAVIKTVQFPPDSELQTIEEDAFLKSKIQSIILPPYLTTICSSAFQGSNLWNIKIPPNSELKIIEKYAFFATGIMSFTVPPHLIEIGEKCFSGCHNFIEFLIP